MILSYKPLLLKSPTLRSAHQHCSTLPNAQLVAEEPRKAAKPQPNSCCISNLRDTQPEAADSLALDTDSPTQRKFLARLQGEISKCGTIDVLRHGVRHSAHNLDLFYGPPSTGARRVV